MCVYATNEMANARVRCMVTYKRNGQTKKKLSACFEKKEQKKTHIHIQNAFITRIMNEAVSSGQAMERRDNNNKN